VGTSKRTAGEEERRRPKEKKDYISRWEGEVGFTKGKALDEDKYVERGGERGRGKI